MRKLAILAALTVSLAARPADACVCGDDCMPWLSPLAYGMAAGIVGAYGYGTYYYIDRDLDGDRKSSNYYGGELILHGALGSVFLGAAIDAGRDGKLGTTAVAGGFAALHLTLATNGARGLWGYRDQVRVNDTVVTWGVGAVTGVNALYWAAGMSKRHGRTYGVAEIAVNAPFVAGFALLAKDRFDERRGGPGLMYAGLAAVSTFYVAHGVKTVMFPNAPKLDLRGTDIMPTVIGSSGDLAPGIATAGTF